MNEMIYGSPMSKKKFALFLEMYGSRCQYCNAELARHTASRDHMIPESLGGGAGDNLIGSCRSCNLKKGDHSIFKIGSLSFANKEIAALADCISITEKTIRDVVDDLVLVNDYPHPQGKQKRYYSFRHQVAVDVFRKKVVFLAKTADSHSVSPDKPIGWKKAVKGK